ncbi:MAG: cupin domain-containing protein [Zhongshania sp.]|uniref:cupin domain-containing protein n=1 Tax=Zhongshania sp. TaxID=1971902 RepID=UPI00261E7C0C|nr:cupin domain-containing protein [Zhongshania sp.]MDF1693477.1 cupin domain-containing protein [Zhongshania sp.]
MALQNFDPQQFLDEVWQRKATLIKGALPNFNCPLDGNDLAGLACEEGIDSRIIIETNDGWELRNGPFDEAEFATLPKNKWTLLVQSVDHYLPDLADVLAEFRFIPRWRTEDIMVSYATDGGNVGPHYDQYDVFLIQASGQRRWKIGGHCGPDTPLHPHPQLKLLQEFNTESEYLLKAGDILYVPPGVAHWGVAEGDDCMTLSVGFRAPSEAELFSDFGDEVASFLDASQRYRDPALNASSNTGEISSEVHKHVKALLLKQLDNDALIARWFGSMMTRVDDREELAGDHLDFDEFQLALDDGEIPQLRLGARLAFDAQYLYADGAAFAYPPDQANDVQALCQLECGQPISNFRSLSKEMLYALYSSATLCFDEDDYDC